MDFIHPYLLAGMALAGVPVLVHLIMRQQPRRLPFPAFRFLRQRHLSNRRKLRLQNLLLLLVRMLVIVALCLALARPRLTADPLAATDTRAVTAVLLFDTSKSMEYTSAGQTRLDDARLRARELLDEMAEGSQVALLDSGDELTAEGEQWLSPALARSRLEELRIRPQGGPLNPHIDRALRLLQKAGEAEDAPPRFLYIFSDRTRGCWDGRTARLARPENVAIVFVDVGVDTPHDLAIDKVEVVPPVAAPGDTVKIQVSVRATGAAVDTGLTCQLDNEPQKDQAPDTQVVKLEAGQSRLFVFERIAPRPAEGSREHTYPLTVRLASSDALTFNNTRYATFQTRPRRPILTLVDSPPPLKKVGPWTPWQLSIEEVKAYSCEVKSLQEADQLEARQLADYPAICLFQAAPSASLWDKLSAYVGKGGGLVIVPGGQEVNAASFNKAGTALLPGQLDRVVQVPADRPAIPWSPWKDQHPITAFFLETIRTNANVDFADPATQPAVNAYWNVKPQGKDTAVPATFATPGTPPALLERLVGKGHVLMLTTPLDARFLEGNRRWHNYWQGGSFGLVLVDRMCRYLAGEERPPELSFLCGQQVQLALEPPLATPPYTLQGPGLSLAESNLAINAGETRLALPQATEPGNFSILDGKNRLVAGCSVNIRPEESLLERVPAEEIESVLGPRSLLQVGRALALEDALQELRAPPLELLPWLMIATLLVLAGESLLANTFNRRKGASATEAPAAAERAPA